MQSGGFLSTAGLRSSSEGVAKWVWTGEVMNEMRLKSYQQGDIPCHEVMIPLVTGTNKMVLTLNGVFLWSDFSESFGWCTPLRTVHCV